MPRKYLLGLAIFLLVILTGQGCISRGGSAKGPMGIYRSTNKGDAWQQTATVLTAQGIKSLATLKVYRVFTDPSDPNALYVTSRQQGLYYSYDRGDSFQAVSAMNGRFIYGFAIDPKDKCNLYASDGPNIYKSTDCSRTWKTIYTEERPDQRLVGVKVDYGNSNLIYAALTGGDILVSENGGTKWRVVQRFGFQLREIEVDPNKANRLYVAAYNQGLYRTDDIGANWVNLNEGLGSYSGSFEFSRLKINPTKKDSLFWISTYGILQSDDLGKTWTDIKLLTPPGSVKIYGFAVNPANEKEMYYTGTILGEENVHVRSTFYRTVDGGLNWVTKKLPSNTIPVIMEIHKDNPNYLYLGFTTL